MGCTRRASRPKPICEEDRRTHICAGYVSFDRRKTWGRDWCLGEPMFAAPHASFGGDAAFFQPSISILRSDRNWCESGCARRAIAPRRRLQEEDYERSFAGDQSTGESKSVPWPICCLTRRHFPSLVTARRELFRARHRADRRCARTSCTSARSEPPRAPEAAPNRIHRPGQRRCAPRCARGWDGTFNALG